ncbi:MAG: VCBS repeat-containing protein [Verrucomicrobiota bacterium]|nr:VCBS repeat-containing protein [Limisphaera sp.]MDW8381714.1 VCBS repeat-containing protein [Verrucomicrobiota bacterium]
MNGRGWLGWWWLGITGLSAANFPLHEFEKRVLTREFWAEGAHAADFNRDGHADVVCGPYIYLGPSFEQRYAIGPATHRFTRVMTDGSLELVPGFEGALGTNNTYADIFLTFTWDFNGDGWPDVLHLPHPGKEVWWYENPRQPGRYWPRHLALASAEGESPGFADLTGDGVPELICFSGGRLGYAKFNRAEPTKPWSFTPVSPPKGWGRYTHGLGIGDVNGDARPDLVEKDGWWEQPASDPAQGLWKHHPASFGQGGAQMVVFDVNGDGWNDVITAVHAHEYGLAWYEQVRTADRIAFREHRITGQQPEDNPYGVRFSQAHALAEVDLDRDGLTDFVTGKRFWAHGPRGDPEPNAPAVLYWFRLTRGAGNIPRFEPWLVDADSGVGTQVTVRDLNLDGWPDVVVGNKKGLFVFIHRAREVSEAEWRERQPRLVNLQP